MRQQYLVRLRTLRMLKAALVNREVETGRALTDAEARQVVNVLVKQRRDSPALAPAVIERAVAEAIVDTGATRPTDVGRVMKIVIAKLAGQNADGRVISELVRKSLGG